MQVDLQDHGLVADVAKLAALQPVQRLGATRRPPTPHSSGGAISLRCTRLWPIRPFSETQT